MLGGAGKTLTKNFNLKLIKNLIKCLTSTVPVASNTLNLANTTYGEKFVAKLDSRATKHFLTEADGEKLEHTEKLVNGPIANLPNNAIVTATKRGLIPLHNTFKKKTCEALIFPHITNASLISVGQLCDDNCLVLLTKNYFLSLKILKSNMKVHATKLMVYGTLLYILKFLDII